MILFRGTFREKKEQSLRLEKRGEVAAGFVKQREGASCCGISRRGGKVSPV